MDWMIPFQSLPSGSGQNTGLSERLLRHLFLPRQIGAGKRVLDFGCGDGELARFLDSQSIRVVGCDPVAKDIATARRKAPQLAFFCVDPVDRLPVPDHEFDLVLARGLEVHHRNLCGHDALLATAQLLATLRPGGELIIVQRSEAARRGECSGHLRSCFARHVGAFPGIAKVSLVPDSFFEQRSIARALGLRAVSGFVTSSLKVGSTKLSRDEWCGLAEQELARGVETCCEWGAKHSSVPLPLTRAA